MRRERHPLQGPQGDTLFRIAKNLSTTVEKICEMNLCAADPSSRADPQDRAELLG
jgi:hypothetical protein